MAQELSVRASAPLSPVSAADRVRAAEPPPAQPSQPPPVAPNPRLRIDGELGMLVIEFRDSSGEVAQSYPNPKEIEAYRVQAMAVSNGDIKLPETDGPPRPPASQDLAAPRTL